MRGALQEEHLQSFLQYGEVLSPRERQVLRLRLGLEGNRRWTLAEIGRQFNVTRERVRQIQVRALRKLQRRAQGQGVPTRRGESWKTRGAPKA